MEVQQKEEIFQKQFVSSIHVLARVFANTDRTQRNNGYEFRPMPLQCMTPQPMVFVLRELSYISNHHTLLLLNGWPESGDQVIKLNYWHILYGMASVVLLKASPI